MAILSYFHRQNPVYLKGGGGGGGGATLQHDMAREICFHFLLEEGWNF